jgi:hypothetical protein
MRVTIFVSDDDFRRPPPTPRVSPRRLDLITPKKDQ